MWPLPLGSSHSVDAFAPTPVIPSRYVKLSRQKREEHRLSGTNQIDREKGSHAESRKRTEKSVILYQNKRKY